MLLRSVLPHCVWVTEKRRKEAAVGPFGAWCAPSPTSRISLAHGFSALVVLGPLPPQGCDVRC